MARWLPLLLPLSACWLTQAEVQSKIDAYTPPHVSTEEAEADASPAADPAVRHNPADSGDPWPEVDRGDPWLDPGDTGYPHDTGWRP